MHPDQTDNMTTRERIEASLHGRDTDRPAFCPFLAYFWEDQPASVQQRGMRAFLGDIGADMLWRGMGQLTRMEFPSAMRERITRRGDQIRIDWETPVGALAMTYSHSGHGNTDFLVEHPLKTPEDFKVYQWIEENSRVVPDDSPLREHLEGNGREGLTLPLITPAGLPGKSAFQSLVEHHVGTEEIAYALMGFPEVVEELLAVMRERRLESARLCADSECDYFITFEDSSTTNYSPAWYERYVAPEIGAWCNVLAESGKHYIQHACGHIHGLLPIMRRQGVLAVESVSPAPTGNVRIEEAREMLGPEIGIVGGLEPTFLLRADLNELRQEIDRLLEINRGAPFILGNSDSLPPGVPVESLRAIAKWMAES